MSKVKQLVINSRASQSWGLQLYRKVELLVFRKPLPISHDTNLTTGTQCRKQGPAVFPTGTVEEKKIPRQRHA